MLPIFKNVVCFTSAADKPRAHARNQTVANRNQRRGARWEPSGAQLFLSSVLAFCLALMPGCSREIFKSLLEIGQLQRQLVNEFHEQEVNVRINNTTTMIVTFI